MQVQDVVKQMSEDPGLVERIKEDPEAALKQMAPLATDVTIYRIVVICLGGAVLAAIVGSLVLAFWGKPTPEVVTALGSAAVGALAGLLAPSPNRS